MDYKKAYDALNDYRKLYTKYMEETNLGKQNPGDLETLQINYEKDVRPLADLFQFTEPYHVAAAKRIFENPLEPAIAGYVPSMHVAKVFLNRLIGRLEHFLNNPEAFSALGAPYGTSALASVLQTLKMFHTSAMTLSERRKGKSPFLITDEYDVQDLLHAILKTQFPDLTCEEHSPEIGSGEKRIDLVLKSAQIVIETKIIFETGRTTKIVDELKIDIESYHSHPACRTLVAFIYNPKNAMQDPEKIIQDLSGPRTKGNHQFQVLVEIYPR